MEKLLAGQHNTEALVHISLNDALAPCRADIGIDVGPWF